MDRVVMLVEGAEELGHRGFVAGEVFRELDTLLDALGSDACDIRWVLVAPGSGDAEATVRALRRAAPAVGVVLLPIPPPERLAALARELSGLATDPEPAAHHTEAERIASIGALTAGLAHDIGTPLTAIVGYGELLARSAQDDRGRKRAGAIVEQAHRVTELIEALARVAQSASVPPTALDLSGVLGRTIEALRERCRRRGVEIALHDATTPAVVGSADRLQQALMCLLLEAIEALGDGGVLAVSLGLRGEDRAEIVVDIPGAERIPDQEGRNREIARTIVEEHGGTLTATSNASDGRLSVSLPVVAGPPS